LDTVPVSFAGFAPGNFKHIVLPFGFSYKDSPLWRSLVPDESMWIGESKSRDAADENYAVEKIIQDIWTSTCRLAGKIDDAYTAEPFNPYTTKKPTVEPDLFPIDFLFIQDVCGKFDDFKNTAQSVYWYYTSLLKSTHHFYVGTNNPDQSDIKTVKTLDELTKAMNDNRAAVRNCSISSIGATLDAFYLTLKEQSSSIRHSKATGQYLGKANVAHVTTTGVDSNTGTNLARLAYDYLLTMEFVGFTAKNEYFPNPEAFDVFPGEFTQTYDPEVALLDLVNAFGEPLDPYSTKKPFF
ncbi:hypothetical protein PENTCL1PPCAC_29399, partial [Pristionchus entomophagus]